MQNKRRIPLVSKVLMFIGIALIVFGLVVTKFIFVDKNTYSYESNLTAASEREFEIKLKTKQEIDVDSVYAQINGQTFNLEFEEPSDDDDDYYVFELELKGSEYASMHYPTMDITAMTTSGKQITFEPETDEMLNAPLKTLIKAGSIIVGFVIIFVGIVSIVAIKGVRAVGSVAKRVAYGDGEKSIGIIGAVEEKIRGSRREENIACDYCGCENKHGVNKCSECGAPLKKKK